MQLLKWLKVQFLCTWNVDHKSKNSNVSELFFLSNFTSKAEIHLKYLIICSGALFIFQS